MCVDLAEPDDSGKSLMVECVRRTGRSQRERDFLTKKGKYGENLRFLRFIRGQARGKYEASMGQVWGKYGASMENRGQL
jgi:hypothetical protein